METYPRSKIPGYVVRSVGDRHVKNLRRDEDTAATPVRYEIADRRLLLAAIHLTGLIGKANFNPNQPRVPRGSSDGGRWTRESAAGDGSPGQPNASGPPVRVGDERDPLNIPRERPPTERQRNAVAKRTAAWLLRSGFRLGLRLSPIGRALDAMELGRWLYEKAPLIDTYLDPPKTLEELQRDVGSWKPGYDVHHIVESQAARQDGHAVDLIHGRDNTVLIPRMKHWLITAWHMTGNDDFGGLSPREYLKGKGWAERRRVGLRALRAHGVLRP